MAKAEKRKRKNLYMLVDTSNKFELPLFVGTAREVAERAGVNYNNMFCAMNRALKSGSKCKYEKTIAEVCEFYEDCSNCGFSKCADEMEQEELEAALKERQGDERLKCDLKAFKRRNRQKAYYEKNKAEILAKQHELYHAKKKGGINDSERILATS